MCTILSPLYICICLAQLNFIHPFIQPSTITKKILLARQTGRRKIERVREKIRKLSAMKNRESEDYFFLRKTLGVLFSMKKLLVAFGRTANALPYHNFNRGAFFPKKYTHTIDALWMWNINKVEKNKKNIYGWEFPSKIKVKKKGKKKFKERNLSVG